MTWFRMTARIFLTGIAVSGLLFAAGCTKKPGGAAAADAGAPRLEEAHTAAMDAEQKLGALRAERQQLEKQLDDKKSTGTKAK